MKTNVIVLFIILCMTGTSTAFARGYYKGSYGGYNRGYYHSKSYHNYHGRRYHNDNDDLAIALAVIGGLLVFSALLSSANSSPQRKGYGAPYVSPQPGITPYQSRICFENRKVSGELRVSEYTGRPVWVPFAYPLTRRVQVPCY